MHSITFIQPHGYFLLAAVIAIKSYVSVVTFTALLAACTAEVSRLKYISQIREAKIGCCFKFVIRGEIGRYRYHRVFAVCLFLSRNGSMFHVSINECRMKYYS